MQFQKTLISMAIVGSLAACSDSNSDSPAVTNNPDIGGGQVLFFTSAGVFLDAANVGNLPDMVKFVDSDTLIIANEGEPEDDYVSDDEGSISIITLAGTNKVMDVTTLGFDDAMLEGDVRIKPGSTAKNDLEPEYIAVNSASDTAWVTLQENNAVAVVDIDKKSITTVKGLGKVSIADQKIDIMDDGIANPILGAPANIFALYQPDTIQAYSVAGQDYYVTANEGDDREYGDYEDLEKAKDLEDEAENSLLSTTLQTALLDSDSKKLRVLKDMGINAEGVYDELYMTGTRSFTIWNSAGNVVFDSASQFEEEIAATQTAYFNTRVDDIKTDDPDFAEDMEGLVESVDYEVIDGTAYFWEGVDARSLKKGVEPEALAVHSIGDKTFAYIGLEKQGGFFVYDITTPALASMVAYVNDVDYSALPSAAGDLAPEGMVAFEQDDKHYLAIANELSSTLALYELSTDGTASRLGASLALGDFGEGASEIVDYSAEDKKLFVTNAQTNRVDIIDVSNPAELVKSGTVDFSAYADDLQSIAVKNGVLAIAVKRKES
jgi:DNA-binding beta-propeller fold protein YncE